MCCVVAALLLVGPRIALAVWWFMNSARLNQAFNTAAWPLQFSFPFWVWPLAGAIFVPFTTLVYLVVFPEGVVGFDWLWLGIGLLIDLGSLEAATETATASEATETIEARHCHKDRA